MAKVQPSKLLKFPEIDTVSFFISSHLARGMFCMFGTPKKQVPVM